MGAPEHPDEFQRLEAEDLIIYLSRDIWTSLKPDQTRLLVAVGGYGRFWLQVPGGAASGAS